MAANTSSETQQNQIIVAEDDNDLYDEIDSASIESSTASLTSSVLNYQYEVSICLQLQGPKQLNQPNQNGRRYHAYREGEYLIPNDEREQDRLDLHHHIFGMIISGELYRAPIPSGVSRILDLGTGTGSWAIDVADKLPHAVVTGTDLSPIQPSWLPPNCKFEIDDFESTWNTSQPFDFIHARNIEGSVKDYPRLFGQVMANLIPGGWFEVADSTVGVFGDDETIEKATNILEWRDRLLEASKKFGKPMGMSKNYKQWCIDAGFKNVTEEIYKVPFSPWAKDRKLKELGRYQQAMMFEALEAYSLALFTRVLGWSVPRIQLLLVGVRRELMDRSLHIYSQYYIIYGQKPEVPETS
ncbi:hypothetical protein LOZ52_002702 [Ophidiomyces ophidiicola]|nr:hypothetical protein LOZ36_001412 [Ophidiomyces ophidiicola]KAI2129455.1 hypothetical protein LOZ31_001476 [Ophidiomyces ophidiicola]KAI2273930.1 hypothetical protein LOZ05_001786 [Ophidiomyces ophidiicola]KAI2307949.1 hypothetical protein LOZ06_002901 [Ophidiomyces ophidiicola]KAI2428230.1 hypothetical protein LOZ52_002702 [Ophidiomyces ophidiicola]